MIDPRTIFVAGYFWVSNNKSLCEHVCVFYVLDTFFHISLCAQGSFSLISYNQPQNFWGWSYFHLVNSAQLSLPLKIYETGSKKKKYVSKFQLSWYESVLSFYLFIYFFNNCNALVSSLLLQHSSPLIETAVWIFRDIHSSTHRKTTFFYSSSRPACHFFSHLFILIVIRQAFFPSIVSDLLSSKSINPEFLGLL